VKIVIAPDSFKESLDALSVARAIRDGLADVWPDADYVLKPMADGGEGTVDAVIASTGAQRHSRKVRGPLGDLVDATWAWHADTRTATLEIAEASGLMRVPPDRRDAAQADSYGTGELMRAALDHGARRIVVGLGGSATNDGGAGLLRALGVRFLDDTGSALPPGGLALGALHRLILDDLDPRLRDVELIIASDVDNPLCGASGASAVFGPQKGAHAALVPQLDAALARLASVHAAQTGKHWSGTPGAGAAGGAGWAMLAVLRATLRPGVALIAEMNGLEDAVDDADLVITGEGRMDAQTVRGKVAFGVARLAKGRNVPVVALVGSLGEGYRDLYEHGLTAAFSLVSRPMSLAEAMTDTSALLTSLARDVARLMDASHPTR
jgi:glycerate kinase